jgi:hypothetical protein
MRRRALILVTVLSGLFASAKPSFAGAGDSEGDLKKASLEAARQSFEKIWTLVKTADLKWERSDAELVYQWSRRWLDARISIGGASGVRAAVEEHLTRMKALEKLVQDRRERGVAALHEVPAARFYRLEAELWMRQKVKKE